jgi:integrase
VLLADAVNQWIAERTIGHSRKYVLLLRYLAGRWSRRWPKRAVGALREDDIVAHLRASWESEHLGASTLNTEIRCLRAFLSWSVARRYAREVPAAALKRFPVPERVPRTITTEEEERLLQAAASCGEFAFAYVLCLCQTGFRSGLVHALRWEWVDLARGVWDIPQGVTKSKRAFCQPIAGALLDWLQARKEPAGEIFWGRNLHDSWREIRDSAGLPGLRRHDLRRTFVTRCRRAGVDLEACMALSDHHCVRTMLRIYRSVQVDETRGALRKMFGR